MFLDFYGIPEQPFGVTPDPAYLYASAMHCEALASLICSVENNLGFAGLIGEPGTGKTTLLFSLLERYRKSAHTAFVFPASRSADDLLRCIMSEFELDSSNRDSVARHEQFHSFLLKASRDHKHVIVIIDEAQNLSDDALESVRLLSNFETPRSKLLHIILAGQTLLGERLKSPSLTQLRQRIRVVSRLGTFASGEVLEYIHHRLTTAGYKGPELFTKEALYLITAQSGGIPRNINAICFDALSIGCALIRKEIDAAIVAEACEDRDFLKAVPIVAVASEYSSTDVSTLVPVSSCNSTDAASPSSHRLLESRAEEITDLSDKEPSSATSVPPTPIRTSQPEAVEKVIAPAESNLKSLQTQKQELQRATKPTAEDGGANRNSSTLSEQGMRAFGGRRLAESFSWIAVSCVLLGALGIGIAVPHLKSASGFLSGWPANTAPPVTAGKAADSETRRARSAGRTAKVGSKNVGINPEEQVSIRVRRVHDVPLQNATVAEASETQSSFVEPRLLSSPIVYPLSARRSGIGGVVVLDLTISPDGALKAVHAESGPQLLASSALQAVRNWLFAPGTLNGEPVEMVFRVQIDFLQKRRKQASDKEQ